MATWQGNLFCFCIVIGISKSTLNRKRKMVNISRRLIEGYEDAHQKFNTLTGIQNLNPAQTN